MAYGFNDDKSKVEVLTKNGQESVIKIKTVNWTTIGNHTSGELYTGSMEFKPPEGYTPIGVYGEAVQKDRVLFGLVPPKDSRGYWYVVIALEGTGSQEMVNVNAKVVCFRNNYIE